MWGPALAERAAPRDLAVVDVGSNSVRLVAFRVEGRAMIPFLNEKAMAGLGRNLATSGRLSPEGVEVAFAALKRFRALIDGLGSPRVEAVATAAARGAEDGPDFIRRVRREIDLPLRIIDGEEEARLSALGVLAGAVRGEGVVGDLGGSSLELVSLAPDGPQPGESFPLGPLSLMGEGAFSAQAVAQAVDAAILPARALAREGGAFFAVGGAWRAIGKVSMELAGWPIGVLHGYEMSRADALETCDYVARQSRKQLEKLGDFAEKRADALPYAAVILSRVIRLGGFERVLISSYGLREGLIFEQLDPGLRGEDPLIASATAFGPAGASARAFGAALGPWLAPLFDALPPAFGARDPVLRAAAARLVDIGGLLHPEQRSQVTFDLVLRAPLAGISHPERAFLATAAHHRYARAAPSQPAYQKLLNEHRRRAAAALGTAMRLAADLTGRSERLLKAVRLEFEGRVLTLAAPDRPELLAEPAIKRLEPLGQAIGADAVRIG